MTPVPARAGTRVATGRLRLLLPLLLLPATAHPQEGSDPVGLGYESATDSHRGFDAGPVPSEGESGERMPADAPSRDPEDTPSDSGPAPEVTEPAGTPDVPGWIEANDGVGRIGGWRTYARELYESDETAMAAKPAGDRPAPVDPDAAETAEGGDEPAMADTPPDRRATLSHDSVLEGYESWEEADGPGWIEANDAVGAIGGWRTYARELYESSVEGDTE